MSGKERAIDRRSPVYQDRELEGDIQVLYDATKGPKHLTRKLRSGDSVLARIVMDEHGAVVVEYLKNGDWTVAATLASRP